MKCFGFYLLAALFTFSVGSLIAFKFYQYFNDNSAISTQTTFLKQRKYTDFSKLSSTLDEKRKAPKTLFCEDQEILPVWKELIKDKSFQEWQWLEDESLNCADMIEVKQIDLNQDNREEILVRGSNFNLCSAVGNCAFWIFEQNGKRYRKLLYSTDQKSMTKMADQAVKTKTKGYSNITLKGHFSSSETIYEFYKFNGNKYQRNKCLAEIPIPGTHDNPKWEFIGCNQFFKQLEG